MQHYSTNSIIPLIKSPDWLNRYNENLHEVLIANNVSLNRQHEFEPINKQFSDNLFMVYGVNSPDSLIYVTPSDLIEFNISGDALCKIASNNCAQLPYTLTELLPNIFLFQANDLGITTALLFHHAFWDKEVLFNLNSTAVIAIPGTDAIVFTKSNDTHLIQELEKLARSFFSVNDSPLTDRLFIKNNDIWQKYSVTP